MVFLCKTWSIGNPRSHGIFRPLGHFKDGGCVPSIRGIWPEIGPFPGRSFPILSNEEFPLEGTFAWGTSTFWCTDVQLAQKLEVQTSPTGEIRQPRDFLKLPHFPKRAFENAQPKQEPTLSSLSSLWPLRYQNKRKLVWGSRFFWCTQQGFFVKWVFLVAGGANPSNWACLRGIGGPPKPVALFCFPS